jgi:7-carboxy-7-deazaguanine synthase
MFVSRQGEGILTGTESYFIRTSGCNLRCWFCDTPYASWTPSGTQSTIESIVAAVAKSGHKHVVLTGGEPMLPKESVTLCQALKKAGCHITIETAGTIDRDLPCDLMSISPKLRSSTPDAADHPKWSQLHEQRRLPIETMQKLIERAQDFQLKFVVDSPADYGEVMETVKRIGTDADKVYIMPQGSTIEAMDQAIGWLKPWSKQQGYHYCDRMQIRWFGNRRGT